MGYDTNNHIYLLSQELKELQVMNHHHQKRINDILISEDILFSCSNDGRVKLFDLKSNSLIHEFKSQSEIYSISKSKHILAAGSEGGDLLFSDLRKMKWR